MPKVKLLTIYAHPVKGCFRPGNTIEVDETEGNDLVSGGYAEWVEGQVVIEQKEKALDADANSETDDSSDSSDKAETHDESDPEFPKHLGKGWYELPDGSQVQGKKNALEAMAALKNEVGG